MSCSRSKANCEESPSLIDVGLKTLREDMIDHIYYKLCSFEIQHDQINKELFQINAESKPGSLLVLYKQTSSEGNSKQIAGL